LVSTIQDYLDNLRKTVKWRSSPDPDPIRTLTRTWTSAGVPLTSVDSTNCGLGWHQQTSSINNRLWTFYRDTNWPRDKRPRNLGGPFITTKLEVSLPGRKHWELTDLHTSSHLPVNSLVGDILPHLEIQRICRNIWLDTIRSDAAWTEDNALNTGELQVTGERLMLSVVPTSAAFNAVTAIGEPISDGAFFGLPGRNLLDSNPGGEYLNYQFGIAPTISDIKNFNTALNSYSAVIAQYHRDADKRIRRKTRAYSLPEVVTTSSFTTAPVTSAGIGVSAGLQNSISGTITTRTNRKIWYAGQFEYHIPKNLSTFERLLFDWDRAYHLAPSPADVWELLPFSWLTDYFTNGGNSLRHLYLQLSEGAIQVYGYVMCHSEVEKTYVWNGQLRIDDVLVPHTITAVVKKTIKQRARVSPFGVNFTGVDLSPRQLAILAALGIAK